MEHVDCGGLPPLSNIYFLQKFINTDEHRSFFFYFFIYVSSYIYRLRYHTVENKVAMWPFFNFSNGLGAKPSVIHKMFTEQDKLTRDEHTA